MNLLTEKLTAELAGLRKRYPIQSHIQCQICGKWFRSLAGHLKKHSVSCADYKSEYDVLTVVCDETRRNLTKGKETITKAERIWLLKYRKDIVPHRNEVIKILGISKGIFLKWGRILNLIQPKIGRPRQVSRLTKKEVIARLQERAQTGKSLRTSVIGRESPQLYPAARRHFGDWNTALKTAGLENYIVYKRYWSPELIIKRLRQCVQERTIWRRWDEADPEQLKLRNAAKRCFGNWRNALRKAGLKKYINRPRFRRWSPELVIKILRQRAREGKSLKSSAACREDCKLGYAVNRYFGGWDTALRKAGLGKYIITAFHHRWTPKLIIKALQERARKKISLNSEVVRRDHFKLYKAARREFGSFDKALCLSP